MVKPTPSRFNPDLLARDPALYRVSLPLQQFKRLQEFLLDATGNMTAELRFSIRQKTPMVAGRLKATYVMQCQRCLEPVKYQLDEPFELAFAKDEILAREMPDALDPVVLDDTGQIHVVDLFEDELILHVPTVPRHTDSDTCVMQQQSFGEVEGDESATSTGRKAFDVLKNLDLQN